MIPEGALDAPAGVIDLAEEEIPGYLPALRGVVCKAVLGPAQQDAAVAGAHGPGQKAAPGGAECQVDPTLGTGTHQGGGGAGVGEGENATEGMEGKASGGLLFPVDHHGLSLQRQVGVLAGDKQGVEQMFHGRTSRLSRR